MHDCEVCGRKTESLYVVEIEGARLTACERCSRGKNIIDTILPKESEVVHGKFTAARQTEPEVIEGYGKAIRSAREKMKLPLSVLGELINEKESTLARVEEEKMLPNMKLTSKLEKQLGIKLTESPELGRSKGESGKNSLMTLGEKAIRKEKIEK